MYFKQVWKFLCVCVLLVSPTANAVTIDFDNLSSGSLVTTIDGVTFSSSVTPEYSLDLVVSSVFDTSSNEKE